MPRIWLGLSAFSAFLIAAVGWGADIDFGNQYNTAMAVFALASTLVPSSILMSQGFKADHRLRWCRKQAHWRTSKASEALGIDSEFTYEQMEKGNMGVPSETLQRLSTAMGVSLSWLKHGSRKDQLRYRLCCMFPRIRCYGQTIDEIEAPYPPQVLHPYCSESVQESIQAILAEAPETLYFAINPDDCRQVYLITEKKLRYTVWDLHGLHLWEEPLWSSDYSCLPYLYQLYSQLVNHNGSRIVGLYLSQRQIRSLYWGFTYPRTIIHSAMKKHPKGNRWHWPTDLLDYHQHSPGAEHYATWYGDWLPKAQHYFSKYV